MKAKFDLDPTIPRVVIVAILLFFEPLLIAMIAITATGRMPTGVEMVTILLTAMLAVVTYLMGFMKVETKEKKTVAE